MAMAIGQLEGKKIDLTDPTNEHFIGLETISRKLLEVLCSRKGIKSIFEEIDFKEIEKIISLFVTETYNLYNSVGYGGYVYLNDNILNGKGGILSFNESYILEINEKTTGDFYHKPQAVQICKFSKLEQESFLECELEDRIKILNLILLKLKSVVNKIYELKEGILEGKDKDLLLIYMPILLEELSVSLNTIEEMYILFNGHKNIEVSREKIDFLITSVIENHKKVETTSIKELFIEFGVFITGKNHIIKESKKGIDKNRLVKDLEEQLVAYLSNPLIEKTGKVLKSGKQLLGELHDVYKGLKYDEVGFSSIETVELNRNGLVDSVTSNISLLLKLFGDEVSFILDKLRS